MIRNVLPAMLEAGDGHIVNVLTWGTLMPVPISPPIVVQV
jgi:short-subunit dehydrogenase